MITIRGVLQPAGIADLAPKLLDQGISEETVASLKPLDQSAIAAVPRSAPGGLRGSLINRLATQVDG